MRTRIEDIAPILIFDTSLGSRNLGDQIIMESVNRVVDGLFRNAPIARVPTHRFPRRHERRLMRAARLRIVGGTNLLSSTMDVERQWRLRDKDLPYARGSVLLGVGWWQYQDEPDATTARLLRDLLDPRLIHSVRDSYTQRKLRSAGVPNTLNTGCPTLWSLTSDHCAQIPTRQAPAVVATVTDYHLDPHHDRSMLRTLAGIYHRVYVWGQSTLDIRYARGLLDSVVPVDPTLAAFDELLCEPHIDYVGTRLHAGIRAMQAKKRALIISIDNRAAEMGKDFGINTLPRAELDRLGDVVSGDLATEIELPQAEIEAWLDQFQWAA